MWRKEHKTIHADSVCLDEPMSADRQQYFDEGQWVKYDAI
jgi:hypothetical protein